VEPGVSGWRWKEGGPLDLMGGGDHHVSLLLSGQWAKRLAGPARSLEPIIIFLFFSFS
jgi:hypothetical protein